MTDILNQIREKWLEILKNDALEITEIRICADVADEMFSQISTDRQVLFNFPLKAGAPMELMGKPIELVKPGALPDPGWEIVSRVVLNPLGVIRGDTPFRPR
ncbi:hypothetical protein KX928_23325 [Roseobacter sp. YSTF-M11]|uniref:Uncharacterized protein n=1 Tax=Roseobacter insulae TaxID=2859783 RepID=A0A9X1G0B0_9RHOB|nr:hypothetical protein [Roseobacter insulae]MBW4710732.1 hypothetical protein [Roseobacter insulae]